MPEVALIIAGIIALFGMLAVNDARSTRERARTAEEVWSHADRLHDDGAGTTVHGPVSVSKPGLPDRTPPADADTNDGDPALRAWRVREKVKRSGNRSGTKWRTADSGLAVGEFSISQEWEDIVVDADTFVDPDVGVLGGNADPFEAPNCYLGEPGEDVLLGELDPINKRLRKWGLTGKDGILSGFEFTISSGRKTMSPDRYQATIVRDGDELLVRGELDESGDEPVLRGTEAVPMLVTIGDLEEKAEQLRQSARKEAAVGIVIVLFAVLVAASTLL
ncbi:hypothetical protein JCM17823_04100 [Halorubrum gandharaense]